MSKIQYHKDGNCEEVHSFIGKQLPCKKCQINIGYEPHGGEVYCGSCFSRLIYFVDYKGETVGADWGDTILRDENDQLHLISYQEDSK
jgi:hypothetical protein